MDTDSLYRLIFINKFYNFDVYAIYGGLELSRRINDDMLKIRMFKKILHVKRKIIDHGINGMCSHTLDVSIIDFLITDCGIYDIRPVNNKCME